MMRTPGVSGRGGRGPAEYGVARFCRVSAELSLGPAAFIAIQTSLHFATRADAKHAMIGFIEVECNRKRPHSTIGYQIFAKAMDAFFERTKPIEEGIPMVA